MNWFRITVNGHPEPAGSKKSMLIYKGANRKPVMKNGKFVIATVDANPDAAPWKKHVAAIVKKQFREEPWTGPLRVRFTFYLRRPKGHFADPETRLRLNKKGRENPHPIVRPDVLKLSRGVEDALTGIVWVDDSQIVDENLTKAYDEIEGVEIEVCKITQK